MGPVVAVTMVKDEADIIAVTVAHMAAQVDHVIVADNGSTDGTFEQLNQLACCLGNVTVTQDPDPAYFQSEKMTALAGMAWRDHGAGWVVPFDADEYWYSNAGTIADTLNGAGEHGCVTADLWDHVATGHDPDEPNPVARIQWRRPDPLPLPKIACLWRPSLTIHQGNHGCDYDGIRPRTSLLLNVRHFPYRSADQFIRKIRNGAAAYAATGDKLSLTAGAHWRQWGQILERQGDEAVANIFRKWFWRSDPGMPLNIEGEQQPPLIHDPAPRGL